MDREAEESEYRRLQRERRASNSVGSTQKEPRRLYSLLRSSIAMGALAEGDSLIEEELIREFDASRNSVRVALAMLSRDGLVRRAPRRGTVIVSGITTLSVEGFTEPTGLMGSEATYRDLALRAVPSSRLLRAKLANDDAHVTMHELLLTSAGRPFALYTGYTRLGQAPLPFENYGAGWNLRGAFQTAYGVPLAHVETHLGAIPCEPRTARKLHIEEGTALMLRARLLRNARGDIREYSYTYLIESNVVYRSEYTLENGVTAE
ncbi:MAG: GntR family transcriptional regulator [Microbacterium sp.]|uniref:GntR family transcriptional regulator n=1 Tax=Microbacterium sp. TaxID=51671 RepID=UPI002723E233|nr:GntR family transcriptional regulator [Microbacterium sp.]MDO8382837.1 GntR family transcriptional regulator [Microbacterium sp.]